MMLRALRRCPGVLTQRVGFRVPVAAARYIFPSRSAATINFVDVQGLSIENLVGPEKLQTYDDSIIAILSHEDASFDLLNELIVVANGKCGIVYALLALEHLRYSTHLTKAAKAAGKVASLKSCLYNLEKLAAANKLSSREKYFAAAALAWSRGACSKAALLLESSLLTHPADVVALRLMQDAYIAAGDSKSVLSCVARHLLFFDERHFLHGFVLGMLTQGLTENGKYAEAEEVGARALERTRGDDVWGMHALMNAYLMAGKSSEASEVFDKYQDKHRSSSQTFILFSRGVALLQRGNYSGAIKQYDAIVRLVKSDGNYHKAVYTKYANILLWNICLNATNPAIWRRWRDAEYLAVLQELSRQAGGEDSHLDLFLSMAFVEASRVNSSFSKDYFTDRFEVPTGRARGVSAATQFRRSSKSFMDWVTGHKEPVSIEQIEENNKIASAATEPVAKINYAGLFADHVRHIEQRQLSRSQQVKNMESAYPSLDAVKANHSLKGAAKRELSVKYMEAMEAFSKDEYGSCSKILLELQALFPSAGGLCVHRDVLEQTLVEALLRNGQDLEARTLLSARVAMHPNDAQSWRRLASLFGKAGQPELSERANYTAWQLGIGQGGFGGADKEHF